MPRVYGRKVHVPKHGLEGRFHVCPKALCGFKTLYLRSYKYHFRAKHMPYFFSWICECGAGFKRKYDCEKHEGRCEGSKEANDKRITKKLRYGARNMLHVQPPADEELIQEQTEEIDRLNQLLVDMQDRLDISEPQIPCMRPLEARLVNVWNAPIEENVDIQPSDNQNNIVDCLDIEVCSGSASEEGIDDVHSVLKLDVKRANEENVRLQQCLDDLKKTSAEMDKVAKTQKFDCDTRIGQLVDQLETANQLLVISKKEEENLRLEISNLIKKLGQDSGHIRVRPMPVLERVLRVERPKRKNREELEQEETERLVAMLKETKDETRGLELRDMSMVNKGRAVFSTRAFTKGTFVVEYAGDLCYDKEAKEREKTYADDPTKGCFTFYFKSGYILII